MAATATLTGAQFDALPYDEGRRWELLDGELIPVPSTNLRHRRIARKLEISLDSYFSKQPETGEVFCDVEFALSEDYRVRPDVFVLLGAKLNSADLDQVPVPGAPDIAIEVISPSERASESRRKVDAYLRFGTGEVWQVYPDSREIVVHRGALATTLGCGESVVTPLLPGFTLPVDSLF